MSLESAVQFTDTYDGEVLSGLLNTSVSFKWTFSGDFDFLTFGLKSSDTNDVNVTLVSLTKAGANSISIPSSYVGRVSGEWNNKISPGEVTFTLTSARLEDSALYACQITPSDVSNDAVDVVELVIKGKHLVYICDPPWDFRDDTPLAMPN